MTSQKNQFYGWINLGILFLAYCLIYGTLYYGYSVMLPAMVRSMKWARGDAAFAITARAVFMGLTTPLIAYMINKWGAKKTIYTGGVSLLVGLCLLGTVVDNVWQWVVIWGVLVGLGVGAAGQVPINTTLTYWFNKNRGLAVAIVATGASVGGVIAQPLLAWVVGTTGTWQTGWLAAMVIVFVGLIAIPWMRNKPAEYGQHPDGISPERLKESAATGKKLIRTYRTAYAWTAKEASRTRALWFVILMYCTASSSLALVLGHGVLHLTDLGFSKMQAAYVLSLVALGGGLSRIPIGYLADIFEARWLSAIVMVMMFFAILGLWKAPGMGFLIAAGLFYGICFGTTTVLPPTIIGNYFSPSSFANINAVAYPFQLCFAAIMPAAAGYLYDYTKSYDGAFMVMLSLCLVSAAGLLTASPPRKIQAMDAVPQESQG